MSLVVAVVLSVFSHLSDDRSFGRGHSGCLCTCPSLCGMSRIVVLVLCSASCTSGNAEDAWNWWPLLLSAGAKNQGLWSDGSPVDCR